MDCCHERILFCETNDIGNFRSSKDTYDFFDYLGLFIFVTLDPKNDVNSKIKVARTSFVTYRFK